MEEQEDITESQEEMMTATAQDGEEDVVIVGTYMEDKRKGGGEGGWLTTESQEGMMTATAQDGEEDVIIVGTVITENLHNII